ncbi:MAG: hypothetical protein MRZ79_23620 [Bacteroidia bacterium]|nr:hypothetical protein [Bacteroidia bacterium]
MYLLKDIKPKQKITQTDLEKHFDEVFSHPQRDQKKKSIWEKLNKEITKDCS